ELSTRRFVRTDGCFAQFDVRGASPKAKTSFSAAVSHNPTVKSYESAVGRGPGTPKRALRRQNCAKSRPLRTNRRLSYSKRVSSCSNGDFFVRTGGCFAQKCVPALPTGVPAPPIDLPAPLVDVRASLIDVRALLIDVPAPAIDASAPRWNVGRRERLSTPPARTPGPVHRRPPNLRASAGARPRPARAIPRRVAARSDRRFSLPDRFQSEPGRRRDRSPPSS